MTASTTRFGLALALASIPFLGAASLSILTQAHELPNLFRNTSKTIPSDNENVFLKICRTKNPTVTLGSNNQLILPTNHQQQSFQTEVKCPHIFSISGMNKDLRVLTSRHESTTSLCNQASQALFSGFMTACLYNQDVPQTTSFRYARVTEPSNPLIAFDEEAHELSTSFFIGTKKEIEHLPPNVRESLKKGFTVRSYADKKGQRHYEVRSNLSFIL